jgi:hypothetical protein
MTPKRARDASRLSMTCATSTRPCVRSCRSTRGRWSFSPGQGRVPSSIAMTKARRPWSAAAAARLSAVVLEPAPGWGDVTRKTPGAVPRM